MKIIERGNTSEILVCPTCGSKLEIVPEDIHEGQFGMCGDYDTEYYYVCPVCGDTPHLLKEKHITVREYLLRKKWQS